MLALFVCVCKGTMLSDSKIYFVCASCPRFLSWGPYSFKISGQLSLKLSLDSVCGRHSFPPNHVVIIVICGLMNRWFLPMKHWWRPQNQLTRRVRLSNAKDSSSWNDYESNRFQSILTKNKHIFCSYLSIHLCSYLCGSRKWLW